MGWLTGNSSSKSKSGTTRTVAPRQRRQRVCSTCNNTGQMPNIGIGPGGNLVNLGTRPCTGNH